MSESKSRFSISPLGVALKVAGIVLAGELVIMMAINGMLAPMFAEKLSPTFWEFFDPILLALIVSPALYFIVLRPMREQQAQLEKQKDELSIAAVTFNSQEGVIVTDETHTILRVNPSFTSITGYSSEEAVGKKPSILHSGRHGAEFYRQMRESLQTQRYWQGEIWNRRKNGNVYPEWLTITSVTGERGNVYFVGIFSDITKRKANEERINFLAYHDRLTELPSRDLFYDQLALAMSRVRRKRDNLALFFMDLDGFKEVNDTYGHEAGDEVLRVTSARLLGCVRGEDTVARLGGDEFGVVLNGVEKPEEAALVANKIIDVLSQPILLKNNEDCAIGVSIGIAIYPENGVEIDTLMSVADRAMYVSKTGGKNRYTFSEEQAVDGMPISNWVVLDGGYLVGDPEFDQFHQRLAQTLNDLNAAVIKARPQRELEALLEKLSRDIRQHFGEEGEMIVLAEPPDGKHHLEEHERLLSELESLIDKFYTGSEMAVLHALKEWLLKHIVDHDVPLCQFIIQQRNGSANHHA